MEYSFLITIVSGVLIFAAIVFGFKFLIKVKEFKHYENLEKMRQEHEFKKNENKLSVESNPKKELEEELKYAIEKTENDSKKEAYIEKLVDLYKQNSTKSEKT